MTRFVLPAAALAAVALVPLTPAADPPGLPEPPKAGAVVTAGAAGPRLAGLRATSVNNLKQIGLACHNFMSANGKFPAGVFDKSGKKVGLSWRVAILPYLEEGKLYNEFKFDEPWDSEHNKKLIGRIPKVYVAPGGKADGYTYYRMFAGKDAMLRPGLTGTGGAPALGLGPRDILDGFSNTFLAVEAADPVIWTKPDDLEYDAKKPLPKLGGIFEGGFNVLMADGSVRFVKKGTDDKVLRPFVTPAGGETPGQLP
jgi:prepilin-type processing-associated H-X9-DG protein